MIFTINTHTEVPPSVGSSEELLWEVEKWESYAFGARSFSWLAVQSAYSIVHSANTIFLLCVSGQRCGNCSLENDCHSACMNCTGHECSSSGAQVKAAWLGCVTLHVTICLSHPSDPVPALPGHTHALSPCPLRTQLLQAAGCCNLSAGSRRLLGAVAPCRRGQNTPWNTCLVSSAVKTSPPGVYSSLCLAAKNTTPSDQHRLRWQGATGKVALQASTPFPLLQPS